MLRTKVFAPPRTLRNLSLPAFLTILSLTVMVTLFTCPQAVAQTTVLSTDFEDGSTQGWGPRGPVTLTNTTEIAHGGARSLKVTGRTSNWNGPSIDMTGQMTKGTLYQVTAWVRLVAGQAADTLKISTQRNLGSGQNCASWDTVIASATNGVTDADWVMLRGQYVFSSEVQSLSLYIESTTATTEFYVDDVEIVSIPRDDSGIATGFESNTTEGWNPRGPVTLTPTAADFHSGSYSLLVTGRTSTWNGPSLPVTTKMYNGSQYRVSVWAKLAPGEADTNVRVSLQRTASGSNSYYTVVGDTPVTAGAWKQLTAVYTVPAGGDSLDLYVETASGTPSFYIDDVEVTYVTPPVVQTLTPLYQPFVGKFPVGGAILTNDIVGAKSDLLKLHFNSITAGNDMKWDATEGTANTFNFGNADKLVCYAQAFGMGVRGHTLVWHNQTPAWVFNDANGNDMSTQPFSEANKQLLFSRIRSHIANVVGRYAGQIYAWDVVNEVIDESQPDGMRRSKWYIISGGTEYIDVAFQAARAADPNAKLYINDYNTHVPAKRAFLAQLVSELKARGVPVDGVGHQMHVLIDWPVSDDAATPQQVLDTINTFSDLGLMNQVTEMDVNIYSGPSPVLYTRYEDIPDSVHQTVGYRYRDYFQAFSQLADEGKLDSVTIWGESDDNTWLTSTGRVNAPLPFDTRLQAKYAYWGIVDPLQLPGADLSLKFGADPGTVFSGEQVTYSIGVANNGKDAAPNARFTDVLPPSMTFSSITAAAGWECTTPAVGETGTVTCSVASLANGESATFTLTVVPTVSASARIANTVTVVSDVRDPNPEPNNTATVNVDVMAAGSQISPAALTFSDQLIFTTSVPQPVFLVNTGSEPMAISSIAIGGTNPTSFSQENNCPPSLAAGAGCTINVTFTPLGYGARAAVLKVNNSPSLTVALSGNAVGLSQSSLTFDSRLVFTTSAPQAITLTNNGTAPLPITRVVLSGTHPDSFGQVNDCGTVLAPGATCTINVVFHPLGLGVRNAFLIVNSGQLLSATLTGTGTGLSQASLAFANQLVFSTSAPQAVTITNPGPAPFAITRIAIGGANPTSFGQTNDCGSSLAAGATCTINVTFNPMALGPRSATLFVNNSTVLSTALSGTAVGLQPNALTFPDQRVGTTSEPQTITLTNNGVAAMTINSVALSGTNPGSYIMTNDCGASVAAGASCTITVSFHPMGLGVRNATVYVNRNQALSTTLTGTGN